MVLAMAMVVAVAVAVTVAVAVIVNCHFSISYRQDLLSDFGAF